MDDIKNLIVAASQTSGVLYQLSDIATIEKEVPKASKIYYELIWLPCPITSMIINLIFVPIIYYMVFNDKKKELSLIESTT